MSGISTGEGLIAEVRDEDENKRKTVLDKRRWIVEGELARLLQALKREGNTLSAILRDIWDTGNLYNLTKNMPLSATNAHIGLTAHITAEELKKLLGSTEVFNGFGNRFLWCYVKRSKWLPDEKSVDLSPLQKEIATVVAKSKNIGKMTRSVEAATLWRQVYFALGKEKRGTWDAVTSRAEAQVVRLSILYALLDSSAVIEVAHLKAALAVWNYCDQSAKLLFDDPDSMDNTILEIVSNMPGIKKSEVRLQFNHNRKGTEEFNTALAALVRREEIVVVTVKGQRTADLLYPGTTGTEPVSSISSISTISSFHGVGGVTPATLAELFAWKNQNIVKFEKREGGEVWVTPEFESKLTASIEEAIRRNQSIVSAFVTTETVTREENRPNALCESSESVKPSDEVLTDSEWNREMTEM